MAGTIKDPSCMKGDITLVEKDDWRLNGQEKYLNEVRLRFEEYLPPRPSWDHDHCEFCFATFSTISNAKHETEGYTTEDHYRWICKRCFNDFKEMFKWEVI